MKFSLLVPDCEFEIWKCASEWITHNSRQNQSSHCT